MIRHSFAIQLAACVAASTVFAQVDLAGRYPTSLVAADTRAQHAREWSFSAEDVFSLTGFELRFGRRGQAEVGRATLGIGHCADGAVWAAIVPDEPGALARDGEGDAEAIAHIWLRFHPRLVGELFPPQSVAPARDLTRFSLLRRIADAKFGASWHAGLKAMIPPPAVITLDLDTTERKRRFIVVDREQRTSRYIAAFEPRGVELPPRFDLAEATAAFDGLWSAFDRDYAMFGLRPELDWDLLKKTYRPRALGTASTDDFARVCDEMLRELRDLHVSLTVAGMTLPGFDRPVFVNANPRALPGLLPGIQRAGREVLWALDNERVGYLAITGWTDARTPEVVAQVLEKLRDARGLVLDVRMNGGGSENLAKQVASRFVPKPYLYAYHRLRAGPGRLALGPKRARHIHPGGPWRFEHPVRLLIGQRCMSSNEAFVLMMKGAPNVTTMGDRTRGSSGNPRQHRLPLGITVNVPRWLALQPDGTPFDETGIEPDVRFANEANQFAGDRDGLLTAALKGLRENPLPKGKNGNESLPAKGRR